MVGCILVVGCGLGRDLGDAVDARHDAAHQGDLGGLIAYSSLLTELRKKIAALNIPIYPSIEEADAALATLLPAVDVCVVAGTVKNSAMFITLSM